METHLDHKVVLRAAEKIRSQGERDDDGHRLDGIHVATTPDEYTLILRGLGVTFTLFFHNKFKADVDKGADLDRFYEQLKRICDTEYEG